MAAVKKKRNTSRRKTNTPGVRELLLNSLILGLIVIVAGFTWSFLSNSQSEKTSFSRDDLGKLLAKSVYESKTGHRIKVEILNGCGMKGLAGRYTEYLRHAGVDVLSSGNADNYHYDHTLIIHRRGDLLQAEEIAKLMGIHSSQILEKPDPELFLDVTIILGEDYPTLPTYDQVNTYGSN